ncbi:MAG TPA: 6-phosphogluconolactonase [Pirellulaceae bacterium]|nr:6-phosphogluconolactonase [Pirellulaceae bacterium]
MPAETVTPPSVKPRRAAATQLPTFVFESSDDLARHVAQLVAGVIRERNAHGQMAVLGLPTGSSPMGVYRELARMHREEGLDFSQVAAFVLNEFYGVAPDQLQSHHRWIREHLLDHINIPPANVHVPCGTTPLAEVENHCRDFESRIEHAGGIDVLLLGIGRNGHIGSNEPFPGVGGRTRLSTLDPVTRRALASDFFGEWNVPTQALTMGLGTIFDARKVLLLAQGEHKAEIIREVAEGPVSPRVPASYLQEHADAAVLVDSAAGSQLTSSQTPWAISNVQWTDALIKRAILWLCGQTGKALLKLTDEDFRNHNLHQLLRHHGPAPKVAHQVFQQLMGTIVYHPAGKEPQRVICFSPHPDDDVISMGGTLIRLIEDGHETHIAYMTSGNIAVFDHDAARVADLVTEYNRLFGIDQERSKLVEGTVLESLRRKTPGEPDIEAVQKIKGLIRWGEAKAGALKVGCREEHLHFLDLPFYRTGTIAKKPICDHDVQIIRDLLARVQPQQIYVAGDLSDPHGTHRVCAQAIFRAVLEHEAQHGSRPQVLLYRGAWQEYELFEIEIAVPLSPGDILKKRKAIFMHQSQKDEALFPGSDPREFWQRAEDRNTNTAAQYNQLGLPEYFAMEAFVRWNGVPI